MSYRHRFFFLSIILFCIPVICSANIDAPEQMIPSAILQLPENEKAILVEKSTQKLFVYENKENQLLSVFEVPCSTGEVGGIKRKAGDKKTPEGIYFLKDEYEDRYLSPIYGVMAFPTDYPNLLDRQQGKNGSAIWIHGTNKKLVPMDSNGCIALNNQDIVKLSDFITLNATPVIMVDQIQKDKIGSQDLVKRQIHDVLYQWVLALESGTYHDYLSFYSSEYFPDISWWESWLDLRKGTGKPGVDIKINIEKIGIYFHDQAFVVLFDAFLISGENKIFLGKQQLFLNKQGETFKIVGDIFQHIPQNLKTDEGLLVTAARSLVMPQHQEKIILDMVDQWLLAWSSKDMETYASFYAQNFYSDGMDKKTWVRRKKKLSNIYDFIQVTGKDFVLKKNRNDDYELIFFQEYESSGLTTSGTKRLKLVNKGGLWKIFQESWKEK